MLQFDDNVGCFFLYRCCIGRLLVKSGVRHADYSRRFARGKGTAAGKRAGIQTATSHATQRPDSEQIDWREKHPYLAYREGGKVKTRYVKPEELEQIAAQVV